MNRIIAPKENHSGNSVDIEKEEKEDGDVDHRGKAFEESGNEDLEFRHGGKQPHDPEKAEET